MMTDNLEQEHHCTYISSRGILKSCHIHSSHPCSSNFGFQGYNFQDLYDGCTIYICSIAIPNFIKHILPNLPCRVIIVSGDCDENIPGQIMKPSDFFQFIQSPKIIHWFSQNYQITKFPHPKISQLPIGLDYHTLSTNPAHWTGPQMSPKEQENVLITIAKKAKPFWERINIGHANFHFTPYHCNHDRKYAMLNIPSDFIYYQPQKLTRKDTWKNQVEYAFTYCPWGNGMDTHRVWEALILGCIPIVKTSFLDELYSDLPILIVSDWTDISRDLLDSTITKFKDKHQHHKFNFNKLKLSYWMNIINSKK